MRKPFGKSGPRPFEGVDLAAAGRKGGLASGAARQPDERRRRELEAKILASKNGAAAAKLLDQLERDAWRRIRQRGAELDERDRVGRARFERLKNADELSDRLVQEAEAAAEAVAGCVPRPQRRSRASDSRA